eukprot:TRINITY_DN10841_c0_g1_i1.p2 TRINITY_DN10841_c0_g1~~TRINITY_DN10841_c0_g1_i1.p2  ORF type:complete len:123 (+),score=22.23 TRINITY_DN10841_c0_g1_i1:28-369(+)
MAAKKPDARYGQIVGVIRQFGTPDPQFPKDKQVPYSTLTQKLGAMGGMQTVLKNMKKEKRLDFQGIFFKPETIVTLIEDYNQDINPQMVTYDKIKTITTKNQADEGHTKVGGW